MDDQEEDPFQLVREEGVLQLRTLIKSRLPRSADVLNMMMAMDTFQEETQVYTLNGELSKEAIIMVVFFREDYGQDIIFSVPESCATSLALRNALQRSTVIHWNKIHRISADRLISPMIVDIEISYFNNVVSVHPNFMYYMEAQDALKFDVESENPNVIAKSLDTATSLPFIKPLWRYWRNGSEKYLSKLINKHLSAGVYVDGNLAACAVANCHGLIGTLNTSPIYRRKGYGVLCMKFLLKQMALHGFIPASSATKENYPAVILHEKHLGLNLSHECDFIFHLPYIVED